MSNRRVAFPLRKKQVQAIPARGLVLFALPLLLACFGGCDMFDNSAERLIRQSIDATNSLSDSLQNVRDAESARSATTEVEAKFSQLIESLQQLRAGLPSNGQVRMRKTQIDVLKRDRDAAGTAAHGGI